MFRTARIACVVATLFIIALCGSVDGQEASEEDMKQANNPLASFTTLNFHNYYHTGTRRDRRHGQYVLDPLRPAVQTVQG